MSSAAAERSQRSNEYRVRLQCVDTVLHGIKFRKKQQITVRRLSIRPEASDRLLSDHIRHRLLLAGRSETFSKEFRNGGLVSAIHTVFPPSVAISTPPVPVTYMAKLANC